MSEDCKDEGEYLKVDDVRFKEEKKTEDKDPCLKDKGLLINDRKEKISKEIIYNYYRPVKNGRTLSDLHHVKKTEIPLNYDSNNKKQNVQIPENEFGLGKEEQSQQETYMSIERKREDVGYKTKENEKNEISLNDRISEINKIGKQISDNRIRSIKKEINIFDNIVSSKKDVSTIDDFDIISDVKKKELKTDITRDNTIKTEIPTKITSGELSKEDNEKLIKTPISPLNEKTEEIITKKQYKDLSDDEKTEEPITKKQYKDLSDDEKTEKVITEKRYRDLLLDEKIEIPITDKRYQDLLLDKKKEKPITDKRYRDLLLDEKTEEPITDKRYQDLLKDEKTERIITDKRYQDLLKDEKTEEPITDKRYQDLLKEGKTEKIITDKKYQDLLEEGKTEEPITDKRYQDLLKEGKTEKIITDKKYQDLLEEGKIDKVITDKLYRDLLKDKKTERIIIDEDENVESTIVKSQFKGGEKVKESEIDIKDITDKEENDELTGRKSQLKGGEKEDEIDIEDITDKGENDKLIKDKNALAITTALTSSQKDEEKSYIYHEKTNKSWKNAINLSAVSYWIKPTWLLNRFKKTIFPNDSGGLFEVGINSMIPYIKRGINSLESIDPSGTIDKLTDLIIGGAPLFPTHLPTAGDFRFGILSDDLITYTRHLMMNGFRMLSSNVFDNLWIYGKKTDKQNIKNTNISELETIYDQTMNAENTKKALNLIRSHLPPSLSQIVHGQIVDDFSHKIWSSSPINKTPAHLYRSFGDYRSKWKAQILTLGIDPIDVDSLIKAPAIPPKKVSSSYMKKRNGRWEKVVVDSPESDNTVITSYDINRKRVDKAMKKYNARLANNEEDKAILENIIASLGDYTGRIKEFKEDYAKINENQNYYDLNAQKINGSDLFISGKYSPEIDRHSTYESANNNKYHADENFYHWNKFQFDALMRSEHFFVEDRKDEISYEKIAGNRFSFTRDAKKNFIREASKDSEDSNNSEDKKLYNLGKFNVDDIIDSEYFIVKDKNDGINYKKITGNRSELRNAKEKFVEEVSNNSDYKVGINQLEYNDKVVFGGSITRKNIDNDDYWNKLLKKKTTKGIGSIIVNPNPQMRGATQDTWFTKKNNQTTLFVIPFQFNPVISSESKQVNWSSHSGYGRVGDHFIWNNTGSKTVSLKTTYIITDGYKNDEYGGEGAPDFSEISYPSYGSGNYHQYGQEAFRDGRKMVKNNYYGFLKNWTPYSIHNIIQRYRSLIIPMDLTRSELATLPVIIVDFSTLHTRFTKNGTSSVIKWIVEDLSIDPIEELGYTFNNFPFGFDVTMTIKEISNDWGDYEDIYHGYIKNYSKFHAGKKYYDTDEYFSSFGRGGGGGRNIEPAAESLKIL